MEGRRRYLVLFGRVLAAALVVVAAGALANIVVARSSGGAASASYYGYCPDGSAPAVYYGYCPPICSTVEAIPNRLWPPNHTLRLVTLTGATDPDGDPITLTITGVTQDEPLNGLGDGDLSPDARAGPTSNTVRLRAERGGTRDGRVYRIAFTVEDTSGSSCSGTVTVGVPLTLTGPSAIDSAPPSFDSFGP